MFFLMLFSACLFFGVRVMAGSGHLVGMIQELGDTTELHERLSDLRNDCLQLITSSLIVFSTLNVLPVPFFFLAGVVFALSVRRPHENMCIAHLQLNYDSTFQVDAETNSFVRHYSYM